LLSAPVLFTYIMAYRNSDVININQMAREAAKQMGRLRGRERTFKTVKGKHSFAAGDRILFLKPENSLGIKNGNLGTIERIRRSNIMVKLDKDERLVFDAREYQHFTHGYASTVHKSQGATVVRTFGLADPLMDRHTALTTLTRHKKDVSFHWSKEH
jgi:ATP-dependent exoDNAse (exonuclease V) alpha subunit